MAFSPSDISGLVAWYDADDLGTITSSGSPAKVSAWGDKSSSNWDLAQATGTAQPSTAVNTQNGRNVLTFDGGDVMSWTGTGPSVSTLTVFIVCRESTQVAYAGTVGLMPAAGDDYSRLDGISMDTGVAADIVAGRYLTFSSVGSTNISPWSVYAGRFSSGGLVESFNSAGAGGTGTFSASYTASSGILVGGRYLSGAIAASNRLQGDVAEIIVYNSTLSDDDMDRVGSYLANRWALDWPTLIIEGAAVGSWGALTATALGTVASGDVTATAAGAWGAVAATAAATVSHSASGAGTWGVMTATAAATVNHPAAGAGSWGGLTASAAATVAHSATADGSWGALTASAAATVAHSATGAGAWGALTASAAATVTHSATAAGGWGALTASAAATVTHSATAAGGWGALTGTAIGSATQIVVATGAWGAWSATAQAWGWRHLIAGQVSRHRDPGAVGARDPGASRHRDPAALVAAEPGAHRWRDSSASNGVL